MGVNDPNFGESPKKWPKSWPKNLGIEPFGRP